MTPSLALRTKPSNRASLSETHKRERSAALPEVSTPQRCRKAPRDNGTARSHEAGNEQKNTTLLATPNA